MLETLGNTGLASEEVGTYRIADLIGTDLHLFYRKQRDRVVAVLEVDGREIETTADALTALRQDVVITSSGPAGRTDDRRRELFTREFDDYPSFFHEDNCYSIVITAGWVPDMVRARETEKASTWKNQIDAFNHNVAYT